MIRNLHTVLLLLTCCTTPALHAAGVTPITATEDDYAKGTLALDRQLWQAAVADFDRVIDAKGNKADAALYWKAYALNKLGRLSLVSATCEQLHALYASSAWNKDCSALTISEPNVKDAPSPGGGNPDYDVKALALNSLLNHDPAQAIPMIRNILSGNSTPELKRRTLSVLAMNKSPETQAMLRDIAVGKLAPAEQNDAIQMMGVFQGKSADETLAEIYQRSSDRSVKHSVVAALFVSGNATRLVEIARNEKDLSLKHDIVAQLALMNDKVATDYMLELLK
jgi:hypothetical protein